MFKYFVKWFKLWRGTPNYKLAARTTDGKNYEEIYEEWKRKNSDAKKKGKDLTRVAGLRVREIRDPQTHSKNFDHSDELWIIRVQKGNCDQKEGRRPWLYVTDSARGKLPYWIIPDGYTTDGIHIGEDTSGQGWNGDPIGKVSLSDGGGACCEDLVTLGRGVSRVELSKIQFHPNRDAGHRDKLIQATFAPTLRIIRCYFGPTKNALEGKRGSDIRFTECAFDRCRTIIINTKDKMRTLNGVKKEATTVEFSNCSGVPIVSTTGKVTVKGA